MFAPTTDRSSVPHDHVVQFYAADDELFGSVGAFLADAMRAGDVAIVVATPLHRIGFEAALISNGIDVARVVTDGSLIVLDVDETLASISIDGAVDADLFDVVVGGLVRQGAERGAVRAYGEMVAVLWDAGQVTGALELEEMWNQLAIELPFSLYCAYASATVSPDSDGYHEVCHRHSLVVGGDSPMEAAEDCLEARVFPLATISPRSARLFATDVLTRWGREEFLTDAAFVVAELTANAVMHAQSGFTVEISRRADVVRIAVADGSADWPVPRAAAPTELTGRGLAMISTLARRWGTESRGTGKVVWAELAV